MKIVMRVQISGTRNMREWPAPGGEVDLPDEEAETLLRNHLAALPGADPETPETADAEPVAETAEANPAKPKKG